MRGYFIAKSEYFILFSVQQNIHCEHPLACVAQVHTGAYYHVMVTDIQGSNQASWCKSEQQLSLQDMSCLFHLNFKKEREKKDLGSGVGGLKQGGTKS